MKLTQSGYDFIAQEEGLRLKSYQDSVGVWTIAVGNTYYEDGTRVKKGDIITRERAMRLFKTVADDFAAKVSKVITQPLTDNQFTALVSLAYNIGIGAFQRSTALRLVNENPANPAIKKAIEAWRNAGGKPILLKRRQRETALYFL